MQKPKLKARVEASAKRYDKIKAMEAAGYSYSEIGEKFGISKQRAHRIAMGLRPGSA
ncbi:MAG TPA: hypothetical protein VFH85_07860 [Gammaproteobacteria bacterium]|nr:hypothetical protein [Gammaproteobacteria bacterium]